MKRIFVVALLAWLFPQPIAAQELYTAAELDELVGPVAMYPDPLLTHVLTGASEPDQIQRAQTYVASGQPVTENTPTGFDSSVHALMSYPDVVAMMAENQDWTSAIGWATANQLSDVMEAVQRFRYQAKTAGSLSTNDKVQVIEEGTVIRIEPADPQIIYVPTYQPAAVVVPQPNGFETFLRYSAGIAANVLLWQRVFNWHDYRCYRPPYGWYPRPVHFQPYGNRPVFTQANVHVWAPNRNTIINRPVNIQNRSFQNINYRGGGNRVGTRPAATPVRRPQGVQPRPNPSVSQPARLAPRRPGTRPPVASPARPTPAPGPRPGVARPGARPATTPAARGGATNYSRTGGTVRASQRGAASRGTRSQAGSGPSRSAPRGGGRRR